tara:strand:+ start:5058 stop:5669 length:612 start_codon:yes stop_codon:yes gene_type:complete
MSNIEKAKISKDAVREYIEKILDITEDIQKISEATYATTETEDNRIDRNAFIDLLRQLEVGLYKVQIDLEEIKDVYDDFELADSDTPIRQTSLIKSWFDIVKKEKHPALKRAGVSGFSKPKRIKHKTKSHIVVVKDGDKVKTIRFGQKGVKTNQTAGQRKAFKSRHKKNIKRGKMSAAYWSNKVKWSPSKTKEKKNKKWRKGS